MRSGTERSQICKDEVENVLQGSQEPQAAIQHFIGLEATGKLGKEAFLKRLAQTKDENLPVQKLAVTIRTVEPSRGKWSVMVKYR